MVPAAKTRMLLIFQAGRRGSPFPAAPVHTRHWLKVPVLLRERARSAAGPTDGLGDARQPLRAPGR